MLYNLQQKGIEMLLSLSKADTFVRKTPEAEWETWGKTMIIHSPRPSAEFKSYGRFNRRTQQWGTYKRVEVGANGKFFIPNKR